METRFENASLYEKMRIKNVQLKIATAKIRQLKKKTKNKQRGEYMEEDITNIALL